MNKQRPDKDDSQRCRSFYQSYFERQTAPFAAAFESTLQVFLNGAPATSTGLGRIAGITQTTFFHQSELWPNTPVVRFALSQILRSDVSLCPEFMLTLQNQSPSLLRAAIRHSQLFRCSDSPLYLSLKASLQGSEWSEFFKYCDELVAKEISFQRQLNEVEKSLRYLSPFAFTFYASVVFWQLYFESVLEEDLRDFSGLVDLVLGNKFKQSRSADLTLSAQSISESVSYHFAPLLTPLPSIQQRSLQSRKTLSSMTQLVTFAQHLLNHQAEIGSFTVATVVPVDFSNDHFDDTCNFSEQLWNRTGQKAKLLWNYWLNRGLDLLVTSNRQLMMTVRPEQQDAVWTALGKTCRSMLQIETLFGITSAKKLTPNAELTAQECARFIELTSGYFTDQFVKPLLSSIQQGDTVERALAKLMMDGFLTNQNKCPITWATTAEKIDRMADWFKTPQHPKGNPAAAKAALEFWSCNAQDFLPQNANLAITTARFHEKPIIRFGDYLVQLPFFCSDTDNFNALVNNLRRFNRFRPELKYETHAAENNLAETLRAKGFTVLVGYEPPASLEGNVGEIDLICAKDGIILLIEMKTSYVRGQRREIWLHRNNTLRKASWQLRRKQQVVLQELQTESNLKAELALTNPPTSLHAWIVDTSIEFDGLLIDDYLVVSREVLEVVLRDEFHLLNPIGSDKTEAKKSFYLDGFTAMRFIEVIEKQMLWSESNSLS